VNDPSRILIVRPSALGDVCRSVPVLASLRRAYPQARIDWLVQDTFAPAIEHHPALTSTIPFPRRQLGRLAKSGHIGPILGFLARLRRGRYDLVLDCQGLARSALFTAATLAPCRVGDLNAREMGWLAYNTRVPVAPNLHTVDRMLELVRGAGVEPVADMRLYTSAEDRAWVAGIDALNPGQFVLLAPTSRWPAKRWPAERFAALIRGLLATGVPGVALVGAGNERDQCAPLLELARQDRRIVDLIGRTSIGRLMALVEAASVVVANDSAALHMAVGLGRPTVGLFGPTRVDLVGPYARPGDVIQHVQPGDSLDHKNDALGRALMERISVEEVLAGVERRLSSPNASEPGEPTRAAPRSRA